MDTQSIWLSGINCPVERFVLRAAKRPDNKCSAGFLLTRAFPRRVAPWERQNQMPFKVAWFFANSKNRDALNGQLDFLVMF